MSLELKDVRAKLTPECWAVVKAHAEVDGVEMGEVVRNVMGEWAARKLMAVKVLRRSLQSEGLSGILGDDS